MKKILKYLFLLVAILSLGACKKNNVEDPETSSPSEVDENLFPEIGYDEPTVDLVLQALIARLPETFAPIELPIFGELPEKRFIEDEFPEEDFSEEEYALMKLFMAAEDLYSTTADFSEDMYPILEYVLKNLVANVILDVKTTFTAEEIGFPELGVEEISITATKNEEVYTILLEVLSEETVVTTIIELEDMGNTVLFTLEYYVELEENQFMTYKLITNFVNRFSQSMELEMEVEGASVSMNTLIEYIEENGVITLVCNTYTKTSIGEFEMELDEQATFVITEEGISYDINDNGLVIQGEIQFDITETH